jgi:phage terminase large subunit-like protein
VAIYFIMAQGRPDQLKVGKAHDVTRRMYELSRFPSSAWREAADVAPLILRAECNGYSECEASLHRALKSAHLWGEWFDATHPLVQKVLAHAEAGGLEALATLVPEAYKTDRIRACSHTAMRAMHPTGRCILCEGSDTLAPAIGLGNTATLPRVAPTTTGSLAAGLPEVTTSNRQPSAPVEPVVATSVEAELMAALGVDVETEEVRRARDEAELREEFAETLRVYESEYARRSFAEFVRQAVRVGVVHGVSRLQWSKHLDATCMHVQALFEGWLVAHGRGTDEIFTRVDATFALWGLQRKPFEHGRIDPLTGDLDETGDMLVQNMIENICPGTLKSTLVMVLANAWIWLHAPEFAFGAASANDKNVERDSDATRDIVTSEWYREHFEITWTIRGDKDSKSLWQTTAGGWRLSRTIAAGFTGQHVHGIFVDDPDDADRVWSESERRKTQSKFSRAMENRVVDEKTCIRFVLQQRVHTDDLTGYLNNTKRWSKHNRMGWAWLVIPLRYGRGPADAPKVTPYGWRDWRVVPDACMHSARFTLAIITDKLTTLGDHGFASQYDQNPTPLSGGMFAREKLRFFVFEGTNIGSLRKRPDGCAPRDGDLGAPPVIIARQHITKELPFDWVTVTVDATFGSEAQNTASQVGLLVVAGQGELRFILDDRTAIMGVQEQNDKVAQCVADWSPDVVRVLVEEKALGGSVVNELIKLLASGKLKGRDGKPVSVAVELIKVGSNDGKVFRARAMIPSFHNSFIYVLDGADWLYPRKNESGKTIDDGFVAEVCLFPFAKRNDRVDALSQLITYYRDGGDTMANINALCTL